MKVLPLALALLLALAGPALAQSNSSKPPDCTASNGPLPETWTGQAFVIDGDTLAGAGLKPHIRVWGIQAPELRDKHSGQEALPGVLARAWMAELLVKADQKVTCRPTKYDRYCRLVALCRTTDQTDLGAAMIYAGYAYTYYLEEVLPWAATTSLNYARLENDARQRRAGLWREWMYSR